MAKADDLDAVLAADDTTPTIKGVDAPAPVDGAAEPNLRETVAWAMDIKWAWDNLGRKMTQKEAGTPSRWKLHQFAGKNQAKFMGDLAPKAMAILDKFLDKQGDDSAVQHLERKSIGELKGILAAALVEAQETSA